MKQYGLVKTIKDGENTIKLCGNAMTFILYKSYFGRDLLNDIITFAKRNTSSETLEKLKQVGIKSVDDIHTLTDEQTTEVLGSLENYKFDSEFVLNFIASLIATAEYPNKPDIAELICAIPPHFVIDQKVIGELMEFLSLFISQKKG